MGESEAACKCVLDRLCRIEAPTIVSIVSQLTTLRMSEGEDIQEFFIGARKLFDRLQQARDHLSPTIFKALIPTGLTEQYENFIVQESFNPSGNYTDSRKRLLNYSTR